MAGSFSLTQDKADLIQSPLHESLLGVSAVIRDVNEILLRLAQSNLTVLLAGESGTGKDIAARLLHRHSPRYGKPFIKVNCPSIPESILESELFGYERGAFTGARTSKPGRFELSNRGTIFLDEIAETSYTVQSKLLQVLDGEPFMRIGGTTPVYADVRIVAATNISLEEAVQQGKVREDIYFRISEVIVRMPALRDRPEDIPLLTEHFNYNYCRKLDKPYKPIEADLLRKLQDSKFRGNVRELAGRVKKFVTSGNADTLLEEEAGWEGNGAGGAAQKPSSPDKAYGSAIGTHAKGNGSAAALDNSASVHVRGGAHGTDGAPKFVSLKEATRQAVESTERKLIEDALQHTLWNRRKAAKLLDISYSSLLRRIDAYNLGKNDS